MVQIKVSIDGIEPTIWRRLMVPIHWNLEQLHLTVQAAFNWWNYHLHEFCIGGLRYGTVEVWQDRSAKDDPRVFDEREVRLCDFAREPTSFEYIYDFGDSWHHKVELEKFLIVEPDPQEAICNDGARARPPEDVGGTSGYEQFLEIIRDPNKVAKRWCGGYFDAEWFDLSTVDKDVRKARQPGVKRRLHQPKPKKTK